MVDSIAFVEHPYLQEFLTKEDFDHLIKTNTPLNHYIGFEISGKLHLGSGVVTMQVIKMLQEIGANTTILLADWHSWINKKLGGDLEFIQKVALGYVKEVFIATAKVVGADTNKLNFVLAEDLYKDHFEQWSTFMEVGIHTSLARVKRSISIMGRKEGESVSFAQLCYPPLQVADIFTLQANIVHAGMDQRKAHVVARQVAESITVNPLKDANGKVIKPVVIHQKLVPSLLPPSKWPITEEEAKELLKGGDMKMSKSKPQGAIFMLDDPDQIRQKVRKAFAPEADLTYNPLAIWIKFFVFDLGKELFIKRPEKWGGNLTIKSWQEFVDIYSKGAVHPADVKEAFAEYLIAFLEPARKYLGSQKQVLELQKQIEQRVSR